MNREELEERIIELEDKNEKLLEVGAFMVKLIHQADVFAQMAVITMDSVREKVFDPQLSKVIDAGLEGRRAYAPVLGKAGITK